MKSLHGLEEDTLLTITDAYDITVMTVEQFKVSSRYKDDNVEVAIAEEQCASFNLYNALEALSDDMHEDWLDNVMRAIPQKVRECIEEGVNSYLEKEPTYYPGEKVDWKLPEPYKAAGEEAGHEDTTPQ